ncbi:MAG TPA: OsmC family protein [Aquabacterium sp.]|nr:OsmC family protein [Aquabacterium sp.]
MSDQQVLVTLSQQQDYQFAVHYADHMPDLLSDEPAPLGSGQGPTPVQQLCGAVGNCLSNSLLFALRKFKQAPEPLHCEVEAEVGRNAEGRLRVLKMTARLQLGVPASQLEHLDRVLSQFEAFCTVTQSVGQGIPITVEVRDATGTQLK